MQTLHDSLKSGTEKYNETEINWELFIVFLSLSWTPLMSQGCYMCDALFPGHGHSSALVSCQSQISGRSLPWISTPTFKTIGLCTRLRNAKVRSFVATVCHGKVLQYSLKDAVQKDGVVKKISGTYLEVYVGGQNMWQLAEQPGEMLPKISILCSHTPVNVRTTTRQRVKQSRQFVGKRREMWKRLGCVWFNVPKATFQRELKSQKKDEPQTFGCKYSRFLHLCNLCIYMQYILCDGLRSIAISLQQVSHVHDKTAAPAANCSASSEKGEKLSRASSAAGLSRLFCSCAWRVVNDIRTWLSLKTWHTAMANGSSF